MFKIELLHHRKRVHVHYKGHSVNYV